MPDNAVASEADAPAAPPWLSSNLKLRILSGAVFAAVAFAARLRRTAALRAARPRRRAGHELGVGPHRPRRRPSTSASVVHAVAVTAAIVLAGAGYAALGRRRARHRRHHRSSRSSSGAAPACRRSACSTPACRPWRCSGCAATSPSGFTAVLFVFAVVWSTDTAAYAAGRSIGGPKLWPRISPNKTWAGLAGGARRRRRSRPPSSPCSSPAPRRCGSPCSASLWRSSRRPATWRNRRSKRLFDLKDASDLIPGHGGFMDRMDGIVAGSRRRRAAGARRSMPHAPARALLFGV